MIASLPMYDRPENAAAHDALWALVRDGLRARGVAAPDTLDRATPHDEGWGRSDLVLGQICNLPFRARFRGRVTVIGAADYGLPDAAPGEYYSVIVARSGKRGGRLAFNDGMSNSGWDAVQDWAQGWAKAGHPAVRPTLRTGSHAGSLRAVAGGTADLAGIDAVTWAGMERWDPDSRRVVVLGRTAPSPGMTFITRAGQDPAPYREALAEGIASLPSEAAATLGLRGLVVLPEAAYDRPLPPDPGLG